jgi:hypothetical protein
VKKLLTFAATAGLLLAGANSASAQIYGGPTSTNLSGSVTVSCTLGATNVGTLEEDATPATSLSTLTPATITTTCNDSTAELTISPGTHTMPNSQILPTVLVGFVAGGTGVYSGITQSLVAGSSTHIHGAPTAATGDTANVGATVTAVSPSLLQSGNYIIDIAAVLTP